MRKFLTMTAATMLVMTTSLAHAQSSATWIRYVLFSGLDSGTGGEQYFEGGLDPSCWVTRAGTTTTDGRMKVACNGGYIGDYLPTSEVDFVQWSNPNWNTWTATKTVYGGIVYRVTTSSYDACGNYYSYETWYWAYVPTSGNPAVTTEDIFDSPYPY